MTDPGPHLFWITSRAAGTAAMVLASVSVGVGLSMGGRLMKNRTTDSKTLHEVLSLSVMVALVIHAASLLGDAYLHPSVADVTIPFASSYKTLWMSIGIMGGWAFIALGLSYYARGRIGVARWRVIHRFTLLAWIAGLVHSLNIGTDADQTWFLALIALTAAPALVFFGARMADVFGRRRDSARPPSPIRPMPREVTTR